MAGPIISRKRGGGSLLVRILLATSVAVTVVFALAGWMVQQYAARVSNRGIEEEVRTSLEANGGICRSPLAFRHSLNPDEQEEVAT